MADKLFTKDQREAVETVLSMGLEIRNPANTKTLIESIGCYNIVDQLWNEKEYVSISNALVQFLKD
jgi:hypothetical protein